MNSLWVLYACFGMGGAFINLWLSRITAKMLMGVQVIDPNTHNPTHLKILKTVHTLAERAGLPVMPEVGIYDAEEVNAFATGPSKRRSLVAVSTVSFHKWITTRLKVYSATKLLISRTATW